jgi:hypothetical protein
MAAPRYFEVVAAPSDAVSEFVVERGAEVARLLLSAPYLNSEGGAESNSRAHQEVSQCHVAGEQFCRQDKARGEQNEREPKWDRDSFHDRHSLEAVARRTGVR